MNRIRTAPLTTAAVGTLLVIHPWAAIGLVGWLGWHARPRQGRDVALEQQALAARIIFVGLTAGLPLLGTIELASERTLGAVAFELSVVSRRARRVGIAQALTHWTGPLTGSLLTRLAMASVSGAPMLDAVAAFLAELRLDRRTKALEKARRLPVTLMIPLGLLILPGFVVLFVGPVMLNSLVELMGSLPT